MRTNDIIGYVVYNVIGEYYVDTDSMGNNFATAAQPKPVLRGDAFRRLAAYLDANPNALHGQFEVDAVYRETTPVEDAADELGGLLVDLCQRHNLDLGLTRDQVNKQIAKELESLKGGASPTLGFLVGGIPSGR